MLTCPVDHTREIVMEMHQVRYFLAVAEELNFTRASEKCNVTQPSLSRAIKLLEEEFESCFRRERESTHLSAVEAGEITPVALKRETLAEVGRSSMNNLAI